MKNLFKKLMLVAVAAMAFTSCNNEEFNEVINGGVDNNTVTMTFVADAPESRTSVVIDGDTAKFSWSEDDKVGFYYVDVEGTYKKKSNTQKTEISGSTATFTASFESKEGATAYNIGAFYPSASWVTHIDNNPFNNVKVKISNGQKLTAGTFDPAADLMISKPFMGVALNSNNTKTLQFSRIAAIGKMNLKLEGMAAGEVIKSVKFGFAEGTAFTGPVFLDLENSTYTVVTAEAENYVMLSGGELTANADRTAIFFTCFPGEYSGDYTIEVKTDKATYTKKATITNALTFTAGDILNFNATVGNREEEKVEDGEVVDVLNLGFTGVNAGTTYDNWSGKTDASGAVYAGNSAGDKSSIQLRSKNNNSGIVTTASGGNVRKVVVTWNSGTSSGRTLNVYGKDSAYTAATDLYDTSKQGTELGTIVCGTSTELVIEGNYEYIGMRSKDGAMYLTDIKITWETAGGESGDDEPETPAEPVQLTTPVVKTSVNANVVTLSWDAVEGANRYTVQVDDDVEETVTDTKYVFEGDYEVEYMFTVKAIAADTNKNYDSEACVVTATTEKKGGATVAKFVKVTATQTDWSGTYLIVYEAGNLAFDGSRTTLDAAKNGQSVTITNGEIESDSNTNAWAFTIAKSGSNYTVKSKSGYYIGQTSNANGLKSSTSTSYGNTITINSDGSVNMVSGNAYLRFNAATSDMRFRYYKSSSYTNQKAIHLYKLIEE